MSTRGSFILRKDGQDKEVIIYYDAYPSHAGTQAVALAKTANLELLYELLVDEEQCTDVADAYQAAFSYYEFLRVLARCERIAFSHKGDFIRDSLYCEYAYVIDLDRGELLFFEGRKTVPQDGNPYGVIPMEGAQGTKYYPCHLKARFSLEYVNAAYAEDVVSLMESARSLDVSEVAVYSCEGNNPSQEGADTRSNQITMPVLPLLECVERLCGVARKVASSSFSVQPQVDALQKRIDRLRDDIGDLEGALSILT